jgi:hypothetical protein
MKIISHHAHMDAFTYRHAELEESLSLSTIADAIGPLAYAFTQASDYNSHPGAAEVVVDGDRYAVVRRRETSEDLVAREETS